MSAWLGLILLAMLCGPAFGQLDQDCTVSIMNRNAPARPDGNWRIDNVPAQLGTPVRASAVCLKNGVTLFGQTTARIVVGGITNGFDGTMTLGPVRPIPESLAITSSSTSLSGPGASAQLTVTARYPSGATANITAASTGTTYTTSNDAIATVSPDGLVQAVAIGPVLIQAINDGVPALLSLTVAAPPSTTDSDGDGIPDSFEIANGLNPNNPVDASEDADGDGLTNLEEYRLGTNLHNPDTDGDGIPDRLELRLGLNPLAPDATTTVQGRVVNGSGAPVAGASISIMEYFFTSTDATGAFRLQNVPANLGTLTVLAWALPGGQLFFGTTSGLMPVISGTTDAGSIAIALSSGAVTGAVIDPQGRPVAGVQVTLTLSSLSRSTTSDAAGQYRFDNAPAGTFFSLLAFDARTGYTGGGGAVVPSGATVRADIRIGPIGPRGSLTGTVFQSDGVTPVTGGGVVYVRSLSTGSYVAFLSIDSQGRYSGSSIPPGPVQLYVFNSTFGQVLVNVEVVSGATQTLNVTLPGTGNVTVRVSNASASPINNALVKISSADPYKNTFFGRTAANGTASINSVLAAGFTVLATDPLTGLSGTASGSVNRGGSSTVDVVVQGVEPGTVRGTVYLSDGVTPLPYPNVFLTDSSGSQQSGTFFPNNTDADGHFLFTGVATGPFEITVQSDTGLTRTVAGSVNDPATVVEINISLPPSGTVRGTVFERSEAPTTQAFVGIASLAATFDRFVGTGSQGAYRFDGVALGVFNVQSELWSTGDRSARAGSLAASGEVATIDLHSPPMGYLTGTLYAADGVTPVPNALWVLYNYANSGLLSPNLGVGFSTGGRTDAMGRFTDYSGRTTIEVPVGSVDIMAIEGGRNWDPAGGLVAFARATVTAGATTNVNAILGSGANLRAGINLDAADGFRYYAGCYFFLSLGGTVDGRLSSAAGGYDLRDGKDTSLVGSCPPAVRSELNGRQIGVGSFPYIGLLVDRKIFVPAAGGFARHLEIFNNPTTVTHTVPVVIKGSLGTGADTRVYVTPSATGNTYAVTDSNQLCCSPAVGHVFGGPNAAAAVDGVHIASGDANFNYHWTLTVPPGQTVILMHFTPQRDVLDAAGARAAAEALSNLTDPNALFGMTAAEKAQVVNFRIPQ